ncbi:MAG: DnaD domain protein [Clostridium sp.]|jgi:DnaD/phage-associated family protein|nr:DnaD domain protein [Clostridium sp.]
MAHLQLYRDNDADSTVIPNCFIDEYMGDANDAQLKVYLYLLRMLGANRLTGVSDIADRFNHTEKEVLRALKYWEKKSLLSLDFDADRILTGIHLRALSCPEEKKAAPQTVLPDLVSLPQPELPKARFRKPAYSPDQLREFQERQDTAQLLFIAESYMSRPLTPAEIQTILFFTDVLRFSDDLIDYLLQYCVDRQKKDFKYIEKVAVSWAEEGISTPRQAQKHAGRYDKNIYAIMNELGKTGVPTVKEMEYITRWTKDYGFGSDVILEACQRTVLATDKHRFEYTEGILSNWKKENVHDKADILRMDERYRQKRKTAAAKPVSANRFNQFTQNTYDFDQLEKELLSN